MSNDMAIIQQSEKQIGFELRDVPIEKISGENGYFLDKKTGHVTGLNLDGVRIKDISFLGGLRGLTHVYLGNNQIADLTCLSSLAHLTELDLHANQITDVTPLLELTNLTNLNLKKNQITDLMPLQELKNLRVLNLINNELTDITPLQNMGKLSELYLSKNIIMELTVLCVFKNLKKLSLGKNQITDLAITPLSALTNLETLALYENHIMNLTSLRGLKQLKTLDVRQNRIKQLPPDITSWWVDMEIIWSKYYTEGLNLHGNPLTDPPVEIVKQGKAAMKNYFVETQQTSVLFLESKLLLIGSGDVGKTTLMKKLKDNTFKVTPRTESTTRGIDIQPWQLSCPFPDGQVRDVNIHFWDFGGQDILHATHQFFLTKRSLYLFVWDPRKEEETRSFDYWLNAVKLFGADSPIIMAMNKADIRTKAIDEASFQDKFPNIVQFHQISCVNGQQIPEITQTICRSLGQMPHLLDNLPKRWKDIRNDLKARKEDYITREDYFTVCRGHGMDEEKALFLSEYLHDLGIILHFQHDPILAGTVILKPEWATGAVYALIDSLEIQKNNGRFNRANLDRYWDKKKYPADKYPQLLRLIEKFELCFNIVGTDDYILPELLPAQRSPMDTEIYHSTSTRNLQLHYAYDFMPAGIITRFISRLHYLIRQGHYWNNGVELVFSGSSALVAGDTAQKRIRVTVTGTNNTQLMGIIRSNFDHIHETLNMKKEEHVIEEVPCTCSECLHSGAPHFFKYHVLLKFQEKGKDARCDKSAEDISIHQLLNGFLPPEESDNLFDNLVTITSQLQEIKTTLQTDENSRNTVVSLLLQTRGFLTKDQTLSGLSASGQRPGELDIKILHRETGRTLSIIEALNLTSLNTPIINSHVSKLQKNYDVSGLKENYILVYASAKDFGEFCRKYRDHLHQIDYSPYPMKEKIEEVPTGFNKIKAFRARHQCHDGETVLYHLLVEM